MYLSCFVGICGAGLELPESGCPVDALWRLFSAAPAVGPHRSNAAALASVGIFCFFQKALLQKTFCITSRANNLQSELFYIIIALILIFFF